MRSGFFNSEIIGYDIENMPVFDRAEEASFFAKYFSEFISNGVFPNPSTNMQVLANEGMKVSVDVGVCYINGYMGWVETAEVLNIEESEEHARIDRVVARLDFLDRTIKLFVKKGTPAGNPIAPEIQRDYDIYEIGLADIRVNSDTIEILQENITDLRLNTDLCGIVANQLQHVDTTTLFNQYQDWLNNRTKQGEKELEHLKASFEKDFNEWFKTVQTTLSGDVAGNLFNLINENALKSKTITLSVDGWQLNEKTQEYEYTVENSIVTKNHVVDGKMDSKNKAKITDGYTKTYDGGFKIITPKLPDEEITMDIFIQKAQVIGGDG